MKMASGAHKFCLQWNEFRGIVTSAFYDLRQDEEFVDVTLCCEGRQIKAHRMMLSACSPYFKAVLKVITQCFCSFIFHGPLSNSHFFFSLSADWSKRTCLWLAQPVPFIYNVFFYIFLVFVWTSCLDFPLSLHIAIDVEIEWLNFLARVIHASIQSSSWRMCYIQIWLPSSSLSTLERSMSVRATCLAFSKLLRCCKSRVLQMKTRYGDCYFIWW